MLDGFRDRHADVIGRPQAAIRRARRCTSTDPFREVLIMSKDSTTKANVKKKGKTIKEKQTAKRLKRNDQNGHSSNIPPTGH
jgi:hypothetical protein